MTGWKGWFWAGVSLALYVVGGLMIMAGLIVVGFFGGHDLWGWGEAKGLGYMAFFIGIVFSVLGVLLMRIMRNRGMA